MSRASIIGLVVLLVASAGAQFSPPGWRPTDLLTDYGFDPDSLSPIVDPVFLVFNTVPGYFTDFELKGSTNNFASLQFFFHSPNPDASVVTSQVYATPPTVMYTDSQLADRRQWINLPTDQPDGISLRLVNVNSAIGGWVVIVRGAGLTQAQWAEWVWSYVYMDGIGYPDVDPGGVSIWRPIYPIEFVGEGMSPNL